MQELKIEYLTLDKLKPYEFPKPETTRDIRKYLDDVKNEDLTISEKFKQQIKNTNFKKDRYKVDTFNLINGSIEGFRIMDYRYDEGLRIRQNKLCPTLTTKGRQSISGVPIIYQNKQLRFMHELECWRLMGFDDEDFYKAEKVNSNTQLYKQAGNSIVVNVLEAMFDNLNGILYD